MLTEDLLSLEPLSRKCSGKQDRVYHGIDSVLISILMSCEQQHRPVLRDTALGSVHVLPVTFAMYLKSLCLLYMLPVLPT